MEWISSLLCGKIKRQSYQSAPVCGVLQDTRAYLNERVDNSYIRTGVEHFVEVRLPVDKFQLVELLIVLKEKNMLADSQKRLWKTQGTVERLEITHLMSSVCRLFLGGTHLTLQFHAFLKTAPKLSF